jgi:hypothetical protein
MICTKCKTRNPIGNKFCKECGTALPLEANPLVLEEANRVEQERKQEQVATLLTQAFALSEANQVEKALPLVQEAIALIPQSTAAHSLLATLYERLDEPEKAIQAMKRVVELNPESAADRAKLEMMQRGVHVLPLKTSVVTTATTTREGSKTKNASVLPLALASIVVASVLTGGVIFMNAANNKKTSDLTTTVKRPSPSVSSMSDVPVRVATNIGSPNIGSPGTPRLNTQPSNILQPPPGRPDPFAPLTPPSPNSPTATTPTGPSLPSINRQRLATRPHRNTEPPRERPSLDTPPAVVIVPQESLPNPLGSPAGGASTTITSMGTVRKPSAPDSKGAEIKSETKPETKSEKKKDESYIRIQVRPMTPAERAQEQERLRKERGGEENAESTKDNQSDRGNNE